MRTAFAETLTQMAEQDERVVLLSGDIGNKMFDDFKQQAPSKFYNCGVAEANMTGVSAGLAMMGFKPFNYTITPFATVRCLEQIRIDVCYHNVPVTIVGTGSGLSYASLGPTHHSCDDIGFMRMLPNMTILCPCDPLEVQAATRAALECDGPVYLRLGKKGEPNIHSSLPSFKIGQPNIMRTGADICILSVGNIMPVSIEVAQQLERENISVQVVSFHTIKPLNTDYLSTVFADYSTVITIEEHSIINGLGAAVASWMAAEPNLKGNLLRFATRDEFMPYVGEQEYARSYFNLDSEYITKEIYNYFKNKNH